MQSHESDKSCGCGRLAFANNKSIYDYRFLPVGNPCQKKTFFSGEKTLEKGMRGV